MEMRFTPKDKSTSLIRRAKHAAIHMEQIPFRKRWELEIIFGNTQRRMPASQCSAPIRKFISTHTAFPRRDTSTPWKESRTAEITTCTGGDRTQDSTVRAGQNTFWCTGDVHRANQLAAI